MKINNKMIFSGFSFLIFISLLFYFYIHKNDPKPPNYLNTKKVLDLGIVTEIGIGGGLKAPYDGVITGNFNSYVEHTKFPVELGDHVYLMASEEGHLSLCSEKTNLCTKVYVICSKFPELKQFKPRFCEKNYPFSLIGKE